MLGWSSQSDRSIDVKQKNVHRKQRKLISNHNNNNNDDDDDTDTAALAERLRALCLQTAETSIVDEVGVLEANLRKLCLNAARERDTLRSPASYFLQPRWRRSTVSGDMMLDALFKCLARFDRTKFKRSKQQKEMHLLWTIACLPQIYGEEYMAKYPELLKRFNLPSVTTYVAIFATRRFGKTMALSQFIAAFMWSQLKSLINVFSLSQRASTGLREKTLMCLRMIVNDDEELIIPRQNQETLSIINPMGVESKLYSYPASKKLRGVGSDGDEHNNLTILEEASFIERDIWMEIVAPLMLRILATLLTISTLSGQFDSWKTTTDSVDTRGRKIFVVKTYTTVCDDCIEMGVPEKCMHKRDELPPWQGAEEAGKVKVLMQSSPDDYLREAVGVLGTGDFIPGFERTGVSFLSLAKKHIDPDVTLHSALECAETRIRNHVATLHERSSDAPAPKSPVVVNLGQAHYNYCFIAVDPAGGGNLSNYSVISAVWDSDGVVVIVGMEDFPVTKTLPVSQHFLKHLDELRFSIPQLRHSIFVVAPECNMGIHANELAQAVIHHRDTRSEHRDRIIVLDEGGTQYGIRTEDRRNPLTSKEAMRGTTMAVINPKKMRFFCNFVCVCGSPPPTRMEIVARLVSQLEVYGADVLPPLRIGDRPRRKWHGKRGGRHDDLAMALQLCMLSNQLFYGQPRKYGIGA